MPAQSTFGSASIIPYTVNSDSYNVSKSLRLGAIASSYFTKNLPLSGNRQTFTQSVWLKRGLISPAAGAWFGPFNVNVPSNATYGLYFDATDKIDCYLYYTGAAWEGRLTTNQVFRDPSAWYHFVLSVDTTQATASERAKIFVNGQRITSFSTESYPNQNRQLFFNHPVYQHYFAQSSSDGLFAEVYFIDGQALGPSNFGYTDPNTGSWVPRKYTGTYGTNGFYLNFSDNSTSNTLGNDANHIGCDGYTKFLAHFDNNLVDSSGSGLTVATFGGAAVTSAVSKFGGSSLATLSASSSYAQTGPNSQFHPSGDFTIDFWYYPLSNFTVALTRGDSLYAPYMFIGHSFYASSNNSSWDIASNKSLGSPTLNAWNHFALVRSGRTYFLFLNGTQTDTWTNTSTPYDNSSFLQVGRVQAGSVYSNGYYDEIRFSNGVARWTSNFTPPDVPYSGNSFSIVNAFSVANGPNDDSFLDTPTNWGGDKEIELIQKSYIGRANPNLTISNNRLTFTGADSVNHRIAITKVGLKGKKYYWEVTAGTDGNSVNIFGLAPLSASTADGVYVSSVPGCGWGYSTASGQAYTNGFAVSGNFPAIANGQVIGFAYDAFNQLLWIRNNDGWLSGNPSTSNSPSFSANVGDLPLLAPAASIYNNTGVSTTFNFGPTYSFLKPDGFSDVFDVTINPRGNYCTLNPISPVRSTIVDGNMRTNAGDRGSISTIAMLSGKWYCEMTVNAVGAESSIGISKGINVMNPYIGSTVDSWGYYSNSGQKYTNGGATAYAASYTTGDIIGCSFDADNGILSFYKNGSSLGAAYTGLTDGPYYFAVEGRTATSANDVIMNFGQKPFAFGPPLSAQPFKALCTTNLPTPSIKKSSTGFDAITYNGTGTTFVSPSGLKFAPDLVWVKSRSQDISHVLCDTVRGIGEVLCTNNSRLSSSDSFITNFNQNGFTLNNSVSANNSGSTYVAWCWKAGGQTQTNTVGSITSQVNADPSRGFSVVSYTGTGANATVGHGLTTSPKFLIVKSRQTNGRSWNVWHTALAGTEYLLLETSDAKATDATKWNSTIPTASVFSLGTGAGTNTSAEKYIAYCWSEVDGYSKFGSYTGNGSTDGTFVYTGFRPKLVLVKNTTGDTWVIKDTSRSIFNGTDYELYPSSAVVEGTYSAPPIMDYLSNGFKLRSTASASNGAASIIFAAFAESPFRYARAR